MKILAIETSCDETAISIVEAKGGFDRPAFNVLAHQVASQIEIHKEWGGVVPNIAKREHGRTLVPLLLKTMEQEFVKLRVTSDKLRIKNKKEIKTIEKILEREIELKELFLKFIIGLPKPKIDAIAVTQGPGLEPALWVGINFARALAILWDLPIIPTNHMEGHIFSSLVNEENNVKLKIKNEKYNTGKKRKIQFPAIALLISGGHTELVLIKDWLKYKVIGSTRDDAVGEAFDKVARLLGLPYPGGPQISRLAELYPRVSASHLRRSAFKFPRPMLNTPDFDFSFSGLKTAVLYTIKKHEPLSEDDKKAVAYDFEQATIDVLLKKTLKAIEKFGAKSLIVGGGVISNKELKNRLTRALADHPETELFLPDQKLSTDNATMIGIAAYFRFLKYGPKSPSRAIKALGNMALK